jgi:hypothetical protein
MRQYPELFPGAQKKPNVAGHPVMLVSSYTDAPTVSRNAYLTYTHPLGSCMEPTTGSEPF